jgi:hypothetical protein
VTFGRDCTGRFGECGYWREEDTVKGRKETVAGSLFCIDVVHANMGAAKFEVEKTGIRTLRPGQWMPASLKTGAAELV